MSNPRRILLADADAYFVACARLADPTLADVEQLIVGGRSDRGVVTSASYACRPFGVRAGMPMAVARRLCPDATVVSVSREEIQRRHDMVAAVLQRFAPEVVAASVDEFYLDMSGTERLYGGETLAVTAARIREAVREETEISLSIGGGAGKTVAKMAASLAKPGGVHVVAGGEEGTFMRRFAVAEIPFVGPVFAESLARRGVRTVEQALRIDQATLGHWVGESRARWLYQRLRGVDDSPLREEAKNRSLGRGRTFAFDHTEMETLRSELLRLVTELGPTLRSEGVRAGTVALTVRDGDFTDRRAQRALPDAVRSDRAIYRAALELLSKLRTDRAAPTRAMTLTLSHLHPDGAPRQLALFGSDAAADPEREERLSDAVDRLRARHGAGAVLPARVVGARPDEQTSRFGPPRKG
jgi:DNA polymerase IV